MSMFHETGEILAGITSSKGIVHLRSEGRTCTVWVDWCEASARLLAYRWVSWLTEDMIVRGAAL